MTWLLSLVVAADTSASRASRGEPRYCIADELESRRSRNFEAELLRAHQRHDLCSFIGCGRDRSDVNWNLAGWKRAPDQRTSTADKCEGACPRTMPYQLRVDHACVATRNLFVLRLGMPLARVRTMWAAVRWDGDPEEAHLGAPECIQCRNLSATFKRDDCALVRLLQNPRAQADLDGRNAVTLVMTAGDGPHLSRAYAGGGQNPGGGRGQIRELVGRGWFRRIFYVPTDVKLPRANGTSFHTWPLGISVQHLLGREDALVRAVVGAHENFGAKRGVLAAWGALALLVTHPNKTAVDAGDRTHRKWDGEEEASLSALARRRPDLLGHRMIAPAEYYAELAKYRFLAAPRGQAIQSSKYFEALLLMTIPIVRGPWQCFYDLKSYGLPIVIVESWDEITEANLERWWAELSPRLAEARWMLTVEGIESLLYGKCWRGHRS